MESRRFQFEEYIKSLTPDNENDARRAIIRHKDGYLDLYTEMRWQGWQARNELEGVCDKPIQMRIL